MRHGRAALALGIAVLFAAGIVAATLAFLWPSDNRTFDLASLDFFAPGTVTSYNVVNGLPVISLDGRVQTNRAFHIVRLPDGEIRALSSKDPHLGCAVPWRPDFEFDGKTGFFRDPCHLETFNMAGDRVFGPSPRGLDRFAVTIENGRVVVDLGDVTLGTRTPAPPFSGATVTPEPASFNSEMNGIRLGPQIDMRNATTPCVDADGSSISLEAASNSPLNSIPADLPTDATLSDWRAVKCGGFVASVDATFTSARGTILIYRFRGERIFRGDYPADRVRPIVVAGRAGIEVLPYGSGQGAIIIAEEWGLTTIRTSGFTSTETRHIVLSLYASEAGQ